jgi:competence protein ComEA
MSFVRQYGLLLLLGLLGILILVYGIGSAIYSEPATVEIIKGDSVEASDKPEIVVDIAGGVEKPGLYKLQPGSRIGDALVLAGGLSATADREWVAKNVNLAEVLKDGGKVYVPEKSEKSVNQPGSESVSQMNQKVNINTASLSELDTLDGIGEARARSIFDNRPYGDLEELISKAKIPRSVYENIKTSISIY